MVVIYYYTISFGVNKLFSFEILLKYYYCCDNYNVNLIVGYIINNKISGFIFCSDTCMLKHIQIYNSKNIIHKNVTLFQYNTSISISIFCHLFKP